MIDRRSFIGSLAALGAAAGVARRAEAALRPLKVSPIRGGGVDEVLKVSPIEIKVGATKPFSALHVSDTHLNFWDVADFYGNAKKEEFFESRWVRFPQALNSLLATLDYAEARGLPILHTGDLLDWNTRGNANLCCRVLKGVDMFYALGNHEYHSSAGKMPEMTRDEKRANVERFVRNDLTVASRVVNGVNLVAFDNGETNLREDTVARVKAEFAKGLPVVLLCHIPPTYTAEFLENAVAMRRQILLGQGESEESIAKLPRPRPVDELYDAATRSFYDWLRGQGSLKVVLCGHTHVEEAGRFSDTAEMYVAGGNYEGHVHEITFS